MGEPRAERGNWNNWFEFILSTIGCLVGLGNVWRFPYVCYVNGGAAFMIPFLLTMAVCGVPLFLLEASICQFSNLGPGKVWILCPLFRGIGYGMVLLTAIGSLYYTVIVAWALFYLAMSFNSELPWATCGNWWNSNSCFPVGASDVGPASNLTTNVTLMSVNTTERLLKAESSVVEFWSNYVLQDRGHSIEDLGEVRWQLMLCLLAVHTIVFFCLFKDIKTSGKVVYVAAILPYVVLLALLIRGSLLPGAVDGVLYYVVPQWHRLLDWQVWLAGASQVFYSLGAAWGGVATLASFNRFNNNIYRDSILLPILDTLTSVFSGFVIFVYLGYMAHVQQTTVDKVVAQGTGLAFIAYPEALATMPLPQLWAVLFFLVLVTVGLDSQFVHVQTISSALVDTFPQKLGHRKRWITLTVCLLSFVLSLPFVTQGGQYVLKLCDWYLASVSIMLISAGESIVLSWIYGTKRLYEDITMMIGQRPGPAWHFFWKFLSPGFLLVTWMLALVGWKPLTGYPTWTIGLGWVIAIIPLSPVPGLAIRQVFFSPGGGTVKQRLIASLRPSPEWQPASSRTHDEEDGEPLKSLTLTSEYRV